MTKNTRTTMPHQSKRSEEQNVTETEQLQQRLARYAKVTGKKLTTSELRAKEALLGRVLESLAKR
jgi:phosphatidate phosphatase PAH1